MAQIKQYNKKTGITYVYESHSYWDKERKQHRSDRKLIGKIDPETGEIVPTRKKKDPTTEKTYASSKSEEKLREELDKCRQELQEQKALVSELKTSIKKKDQILDKIRAMIG